MHRLENMLQLPNAEVYRHILTHCSLTRLQTSEHTAPIQHIGMGVAQITSRKRMPPPPILPPKHTLKVPRVHVPGSPPSAALGGASTVPIIPPPLHITTQANLGYQAAHALFNVTQQCLREYAHTRAKGKVVTVMATLMTRVLGQ